MYNFAESLKCKD